jgi:hypothetical protein
MCKPVSEKEVMLSSVACLFQAAENTYLYRTLHVLNAHSHNDLLKLLACKGGIVQACPAT